MAMADREANGVSTSEPVVAAPAAERGVTFERLDTFASKEDLQGSTSTNSDFVWRFRIDEKPARVMLEHPLDELLRVQWEELLKLCIPTHDGRPVKVDGFATMREPRRILPIFSDDPKSPPDDDNEVGGQ